MGFMYQSQLLAKTRRGRSKQRSLSGPSTLVHSHVGMEVTRSIAAVLASLCIGVATSSAQTIASPATDLFTEITLNGGPGFGTVVANAGDLDGDGREDLAVLTEHPQDPLQSKIDIFSSNRAYFSGGIPSTPIATVPAVSGLLYGEGTNMTWADLNADGRSELYVGIPKAYNQIGVVLMIQLQPFTGAALGANHTENRVASTDIVSVIGNRQQGAVLTSQNPQTFQQVGGAQFGAAIAPIKQHGVRTAIAVGAPFEQAGALNGLPHIPGAVVQLAMLNRTHPLNGQNVREINRVNGPRPFAGFGEAVAICRRGGHPTEYNLIVGSPRFNFWRGAADRYKVDHVSASFRDRHEIGAGVWIYQGSLFGANLSCLGAAESNEQERVVIGAPGLISGTKGRTGGALVFGTGFAERDAVVKLFGGGSFSSSRAEDGARIGNKVLATVDLNGDGHRDLLYGALPQQLPTAIHHNGLLYFDSFSTAADRTYNPTTRGLVVGANVGDRYAESFDTIDYNDDGFTALAIGIPGANQVQIAIMRSIIPYGPRQPMSLAISSGGSASVSSASASGTMVLAASAAGAYQTISSLPGASPTRIALIDPAQALATRSLGQGTSATFQLPGGLRQPFTGMRNRDAVYFQAWSLIGTSPSFEASNGVRVVYGHK